jgi:3-dehydroquinate dehydratase-1
MISHGHLVGLLGPRILSELEHDPNGEIAQAVALCSALEIRYDWFPKRVEWPNLSGRLRKVCPDKLQIGTIRLVRDGGIFPNTKAPMRMKNWGPILSAESVPDILDLEQDCLFDFEALKSFASLKGSKIIISQHNFSRVPPYPVLVTLVQDALRVGADGVKIAAMSNAEGDCEPIYQFIKDFSSQFSYFSAFAMGNSGQASRLLSLLKGANLSYGSILSTTVPGQISVVQMNEILKNINENTSETEIRKLLDKSFL